MRRTTHLTTAAVATLAILGLAACSSGSEPESAPPTSTAPSLNSTPIPTPSTTTIADPSGDTSGIRTPDLKDCYLTFNEDLPAMKIEGEPFVTEQQATDAWKQMTCYSAVAWTPTFLSNTLITPEQAAALTAPYMTANAIAKFTPQYEKY